MTKSPSSSAASSWSSDGTARTCWATGRKPKLSHAVDRVLESWPPEAQFTATSLATEVRRRYGAVLGRDVDPRAIAAALRRRRDEDRIQEIRGGRPHLEAQYRKAG